MTRWIRVLLTILRSWRLPRLGVDQESDLTFRVWPTDADLSIMNHATFLTIMEQGRIDFLFRTGFIGLLRRHHWSAVLGSITVQFRSPLRRFQRYQLGTRVACWDSDWIYLEHRVSRADKLVACGLARIAIVARAGRVSPVEALLAFGLSPGAPPAPDMVPALQRGEQLMHDRIRDWPDLEWSLGLPRDAG
ncbi:MAG TPA: thioesterase family protein [Gemmatimonadales bacterium]|nr:thioesterase family protein [Gemmatimonadales bacterium]